MAPLIMLEDADAREARHASSSMVRGKTATVLGAWIVAFLVTIVVPTSFAVRQDVGGLELALFDFAWSSLTAPYYAHVLTVIYYKLADPDQPVIHPDVAAWKSVWNDER